MSQRVNMSSIGEFVEFAGEAAAGLGSVVNSTPWLTGAYQQMCNIWSGTGVPQGLEAVGVGSVCTPFLNAQNRAFARGIQPFRGGQCETTYRVTSGPRTFRDGQGNINTVPADTIPAEGPGPLSFVQDQNGQRWRIRSATGGFLGTFNVSNQGPDASIVNPNWIIERVDGQPDNCGDPPRAVVPGQGYRGEEYDVPVNYTDPSGRDWPITVSPPEVSPDGDIEIVVDVGGFEVAIPGGASEDSGSGVDNPGVSAVGTEEQVGTGDGEGDLPPAPDGSVTIGVIVRVNGIPPSEGIIVGSAPNLRYYAPLGNVSLKLRADDGIEFWGEDVILRAQETFQSVPHPGLEAVGYRVNVSVGSSATIVPVVVSLTEGKANDE